MNEALPWLNLGLLRNLKGIIKFDAQVPNGTLDLCVPKKQLDGTKISGSPIDEGRLRSPHGVGTVGRIVEANFANPLMNDPGVLPGG